MARGFQHKQGLRFAPVQAQGAIGGGHPARRFSARRSLFPSPAHIVAGYKSTSRGLITSTTLGLCLPSPLPRIPAHRFIFPALPATPTFNPKIKPGGSMLSLFSFHFRGRQKPRLTGSEWREASWLRLGGGAASFAQEARVSASAPPEPRAPRPAPRPSPSPAPRPPKPPSSSLHRLTHAAPSSACRADTDLSDLRPLLNDLTLKFSQSRCPL